MNITTNGAASINVSVELNGTIYTGGLHAVFQGLAVILPEGRHWVLDGDDRAGQVVLDTNPRKGGSEVN